MQIKVNSEQITAFAAVILVILFCCVLAYMEGKITVMDKIVRDIEFAGKFELYDRVIYVKEAGND